MTRFVAILVVGVGLLPLSAVHAQGTEPMAGGKKLSEWQEQLRGEKDVRTRVVSPLLLGFGGAHSNLWLAQTNRRRAGLIGLQLIGADKSPLVLPSIIDALRDDPDDSLRAAAAIALGSQAARPKQDLDLFLTAGSALLGAVKDDRAARVREAAAESLGKMTGVPNLGKDAIPALAVTLKDPSPDPRRAAADSLRRWGKAAAPALPDLQEILQKTDSAETTRVLAVRAIGAIGAPEALAALPALKDVIADARAPTDLRSAAVETVGGLGPDAAAVTPLLGQVLTAVDTPLTLRQELAAALAKFGPASKDALPDLKKAVRDPDKFVRCQVLYAFGRIGKDLGDEITPVTKLLLDALIDPMLEVRLAAIETLGKLGPEVLGPNTDEVRKHLMEFTRDPIKEVKEAAEVALVRLRPAP